MSKTSSIRQRIAESPRLTAAVFTLFLFLTQAGNATAGGSALPGP